MLARSPPSLPLLDGADLSAPATLARVPRSLSVPRAPLVSVANHSTRALSLSALWASLVSSIFPATVADPRPRTR
jgi:hypothetical protein